MALASSRCRLASRTASGSIPRRLLLLRAGRSLGQRRRPGDLRPPLRGARAVGSSRGRPSPVGALPSDAPRRFAAFGRRGRHDRGGRLRRGSERRRVSLSVRFRGALRGGGRAGKPRGPVRRVERFHAVAAALALAFSLLAKAEIGAAAAVVVVVAALRTRRRRPSAEGSSSRYSPPARWPPRAMGSRFGESRSRRWRRRGRSFSFRRRRNGGRSTG